MPQQNETGFVHWDSNLSIMLLLDLNRRAWKPSYCVGVAAAQMPVLSKNAECVLRIIQNMGSLTTSAILEAARKEEYAEICDDCAGGDSFVDAANQLVELGLVEKKFGRGGYRWYLRGVGE
jgi:hypothetical protein